MLSNQFNQQNLFPTPWSASDRLVLSHGIRFLSTKCNRIPTPIVQKYFNLYKLHYWTGTHLLNQIEAGLICRYDTAFIVHYHGGLTRGKILEHSDKQYAVSFRHGLFNDPIVLISTT